MANYAVTDLASLKRVSKQLGDRNYSCMQTASARGLSRATAAARAAMLGKKGLINQHVKKPAGRGGKDEKFGGATPFTHGTPTKRSGAAFFEGANVKDRIDNQSATLALGKEQSRYLNPIIVGSKPVAPYEDEVLVPRISALKRKPVKDNLGIKVDRFGNIVDLKATLRRIRANKEWFFEVKTAGNRLPKGGYYRNKQKNGRVKGYFTLWTIETPKELDAQFPFPELARDAFVKAFPDAFTKSLKECLDKK